MQHQARLNRRVHLSVVDPWGGCHTAWRTVTSKPPPRCDSCTVKGFALRAVSGSVARKPSEVEYLPERHPHCIRCWWWDVVSKRECLSQFEVITLMPILAERTLLP